MLPVKRGHRTGPAPERAMDNLIIGRTVGERVARGAQRWCGDLSDPDSVDAQSVWMAASSIIIASRFLESSNDRLVISAILRSR
ncbi:hypothetical protein JHV675_03330 [Mycobacterium avium subsp. hominissuis]|uniref:Uncharacterized protein n=1 Tax=Mycobacterium avium subsp. hominissuis TaxID=439334 RepID=A0AAI8X2A4_MYCAV|nr:hypothetical protein JPH1_20710 [Mycobacterium avium subsp. hominissuis]